MKYSPSEFVNLLSEKVIGQEDAKKTIAIALRNRWRRTKLSTEDKNGISPKNILMIGSTGVGKTAINRAMADLIDAPFIKVEATRFTQVGYYGEDVNTIIEQIAREGYEKYTRLKRATYSSDNDYKTHLTVKKANVIIEVINACVREELDTIYDKVCQSEVVDFEVKRQDSFYTKNDVSNFKVNYRGSEAKLVDWMYDNNLVIETLMASYGHVPEYLLENIKSEVKKLKVETELRKALSYYFNENKFIRRIVSIIDPISSMSLRERLHYESSGSSAVLEISEGKLRGFIKQLIGKMEKENEAYIQSYIDYLYTFVNQDPFLYEKNKEDKAEVDIDKFKSHIEYTESMGIVFIDEIDKLADTSNSSDNVGKIGVQRDLLAILDGTTIDTSYGPIKTDNILFIAAGAFSLNQVSDLMPELLGRLPVHVKLDDMDTNMMKSILENEKVSPVSQYVKLMRVDNVIIEISDGVIDAIAKLSNYINRNHKDMGARTLHAVVEKVFSKYSYTISDDENIKTVNITKQDVQMVRNEIDSKISKDFWDRYLSTQFIQ